MHVVLTYLSAINGQNTYMYQQFLAWPHRYIGRALTLVSTEGQHLVRQHHLVPANINWHVFLDTPILTICLHTVNY